MLEKPAENLVESLTKGARVIVQGRLEQKSFENRVGEKRTVVEMTVDEVGRSLRYATATVEKKTGKVPVAASASHDEYDGQPPF